MISRLAQSDPLREFLADEYRPDDPIWNFLRYKFGTHTVTIDGERIGHVDQFHLRDELRAVRAEGFEASPDTIFSLWNTLTQAIALDSGDAYYRDYAVLGKTTFSTLDACVRVGGRWCAEAARCPQDERYLGVRLLLDMIEAGRYRPVTDEYAYLARLIHLPGNAILMPVIGDGRPSTLKNLNVVRASRNRDRDYFDRTLNRIRSGEYNAFFPDPTVADPQVAARFRLVNKDGAPTPEAFATFVAAQHLGMFLTPNGSVEELWPGSLTTSGLPGSRGHCRQWIARAEAKITERDDALARTAEATR